MTTEIFVSPYIPAYPLAESLFVSHRIAHATQYTAYLTRLLCNQPFARSLAYM